MKITTMLGAAGLAIAAMGISTGASAQGWDHQGRDGYRDHGRHDRYDRYDRHDRDGRYRHYGWDRGRHYGWDRHPRRCWTEWRYHHRVRICR